MKAEIVIFDPTAEKAYIPAVEEGIEWTTERRGSPGKLTCKVVNDKILHFSEGSMIQLRVDEKPVFSGFVFRQQRDREGIITITAYDQLRYLKNKDSILYENQTADALIRMLAQDYALEVGVLENTGYVIPYRVEKNTSFFEMIENALELTTTNTGEKFVLYDDFGKLTLKRLSSMIVGTRQACLLLDADSSENFEYTSSIDENTYNRIKLIRDNEDVKNGDCCIASSPENMRLWGILQYVETMKEGANGQAKVDALLKLYNKKTRSLKLTGVVGDNRVRAGSLLAVNLDLGDAGLQSQLLVERCKHTYQESEHSMDLTLTGGDFIG